MGNISVWVEDLVNLGDEFYGMDNLGGIVGHGKASLLLLVLVVGNGLLSPLDIGALADIGNGKGGLLLVLW